MARRSAYGPRYTACQAAPIVLLLRQKEKSLARDGIEVRTTPAASAPGLADRSGVAYAGSPQALSQFCFYHIVIELPDNTVSTARTFYNRPDDGGHFQFLFGGVGRRAAYEIAHRRRRRPRVARKRRGSILVRVALAPLNRVEVGHGVWSTNVLAVVCPIGPSSKLSRHVISVSHRVQ
jgi:hypothetical protein